MYTTRIIRVFFYFYYFFYHNLYYTEYPERILYELYKGSNGEGVDGDWLHLLVKPVLQPVQDNLPLLYLSSQTEF